MSVVHTIWAAKLRFWRVDCSYLVTLLLLNCKSYFVPILVCNILGEPIELFFTKVVEPSHYCIAFTSLKSAQEGLSWIQPFGSLGRMWHPFVEEETEIVPKLPPPTSPSFVPCVVLEGLLTPWNTFQKVSVDCSRKRQEWSPTCWCPQMGAYTPVYYR